ncbi:MAG TPA: phospholipase D-like domain-containing protein [Gammaproteobacteria bacterium]|nr:phospholipase D-like domain-containing protein [Gammaproteobacteria bacterium]
MQAMGVVGTAAAAVGFIAAVAASTHALLYKRRPQSAFGWIALCFSLPLAGALLYYFFGINRVKTRARKLLTRHPAEVCPTEHLGAPPPGLEPLGRLGYAVTDLPLTTGNHVRALHNGEHTFPAMLAAIRGATRRVFLSTYIFETGPLGREFVAALAAAAARGVDVRVLLDGIGEFYSLPRASTLLRKAGVRVARFLPPRLWPPLLSVNLRNHRKILAVDGTLAFTGGVNIRESYLAKGGAKIVDLHASLAGPVVAQVESVFLRDWHFVTGEGARTPATHAELPGRAECRAIADGPERSHDRLTELLVGAIGAARKRVAIMTPYFLPPRELIAPLQAAALEGVDVAVILPARNNLPYVHRATRHMLWELLERGVQVYYQPGPFAHSKLFYVDEDYAQIGSANLDPRSLRLNFEMNVEVYDRRFVSELSEHFEAVRARSKRITVREVDARALRTKLVDGAAWLFSPYL